MNLRTCIRINSTKKPGVSASGLPVGLLLKLLTRLFFRGKMIEKGGGYMKKIYNPKLILYLFLPFVGMIFGCLFFIVGNYVFGSVFLGLSLLTMLLFILFVPRNYYIDRDGIRIFYGFKKCNFITWKSIYSIDLRYDARFDFFWFCKDFVVSHNNMKNHIRLIDTVTRTKRTESEIKKYWWKNIE